MDHSLRIGTILMLVLFQIAKCDLGPILSAGEAIVIVDAGATITTPGNYRLSRNLTVASGIGINIASSDVFLDLNNYELIGTGGTTGINIPSDLSNITIKNGIIRDFTVGIGIDTGIENFIFENLRCFGSGLSGIVFVSGSNVQLINCIVDDSTTIGMDVQGIQQLIIDNCICSNNGSIGCQVNTCEEAIIKNSHFFSNGSIGFLFEASISGIIKDSEFFNNSGGGLSINVCDQITVQNCKATNCGGFGFNVSTATQVIMQNCSAEACTLLGFAALNSRMLNYENCNSFRTTATGVGAAAAGFQDLGCVDVLYDHCVSMSSVGTLSGIGFNSPTTPVKIVMNSCIANNNIGGTTSIGFNFNGATNCCILNCLAKENTGAVGGTGFQAQSGSNLHIRDNTAISNGAAGFLINEGTLSSVIFGNVAQNHTTNYSITGGTILTVVYDLSATTLTPTPAPYTNLHNVSVVP